LLTGHPSARIVQQRRGDSRGVQQRAQVEPGTSRTRESPPDVVDGYRARVHVRDERYSSPFGRSEEHTSELQSRENLVCRLLLEKKKAHPDSRSNRAESL